MAVIGKILKNCHYKDRILAYANRNEKIVAIVLLIACCVLTICNPSIQNCMFNSDQLTVPSFVEDIISNPHFSSITWMIPRAPYAFPDFPCYFIVRLLTGDAYTAILIYAVLHVLAIIFVATLILRRTMPTIRQAWIAIFAFLMLCWITLILACDLPNGSILYWPFVSIAHATAAGSAVIMFCIYERVIDNRINWKHFLAVILCTIMLFSDRFFIVFFCLPYIAALLFSRCTIRKLAIFITEMGIALGASDYISRFFIQQNIDPIEFKLYERISTIIKVIRHFGFLPWLWIICGIIAAIMLAWHAFPLNKSALRYPLNVRRARIFISAMTGFGFFASIILWRAPYIGYGRYMVGIEFGALISGAVILAENTPDKLGIRTNFTILTLLLVVIVSVFGSRINSPLQPFKDRQYIADSMLYCKKKYKIKSGYADYRIARQISMATGWRTQVNQFYPGQPRLFFWGNNFLWFYYDRISGKMSNANFIIDQSLKRKDIEQLYGEHKKEGDCGCFHVLLYDNDNKLRQNALGTLSLDWIFNKKIEKHFPSNLIHNLEALHTANINLSTMSHQIGNIAGGVATAHETSDQKGCLLFGPYITLPMGSYDIELDFICAGNSLNNILDVTAQTGNEIIAKMNINSDGQSCNGQPKKIKLSFRLNKKKEGVEFRTYFGGVGMLKVTGMKIRQEGY
jgi:hypothetical protein